MLDEEFLKEQHEEIAGPSEKKTKLDFNAEMSELIANQNTAIMNQTNAIINQTNATRLQTEVLTKLLNFFQNSATFQ